MSQRVWFITGVSRGLGRALVEQALLAGDYVIGTSRNGSIDLPSNDRLHILPLDVRRRADIVTTVEAAYQLHKRLDVVVNNAGYGLLGSIESSTEEQVRDVMDVNFFGTVNVTQAVLPYLRKQRSGHILNITSIAGISPPAGAAFYAASKFAVEGFSLSLKQELEPLGISVTAIEPGAFRTDFLDSSSIRFTDEAIDDYAETSGKARQLFKSLAGKQMGDPQKLVIALLSLVDAPKGPAHLLLGSDALRRAKKYLESFSEEISTWEPVTVSTDFD